MSMSKRRLDREWTRANQLVSVRCRCDRGHRVRFWVHVDAPADVRLQDKPVLHDVYCCPYVERVTVEAVES